MDKITTKKSVSFDMLPSTHPKLFADLTSQMQMEDGREMGNFFLFTVQTLLSR